MERLTSCLNGANMNKAEKITYFEVNTRSAGYDYPFEEPLYTWMDSWEPLWETFLSDEWARANGIIVSAKYIEEPYPAKYNLKFPLRYFNLCITAPTSWIWENCPCLFDSKNLRFLRKPNGGDLPKGERGTFVEYSDKTKGRIFRENFTNEQFET